MTTSAVLSPGIKSLHLSLDTPVDPVTGKVRRDLSGIRVWYSTQSGFNPNNSEGIQAFNGLSSDITVSNLLESTQYFVRYAFISAIDPTVYTISQQLSALTYDENVSVYGNLTNPSSIIPTNPAGTDGDYTVAGGVFKVYKYSTEVTGTGVEYALESGTIVGGLAVSINPNTGAYTVTGLTDDYGSVILSATYDGVTIQTTLVVIKARAGVDGTNAQLLTINAEGTAFVFKDSAASTSDTAKLTLIANLKNVTGTVTWSATAFDKNSDVLGPIEFTQTGNAIDISAQQFNPPAYTNSVAFIIVNASRSTLSDTVMIYRINNGTDQIVLEFTNDSHTIPAYYDGTTVPASYIGSGTEIRVKQGNQYLTVDNTVPYAPGTWTVTAANGVNITPDTTPGIFSSYINYDTHSNMTADRAHIDYTVTGTSLTGASFSFTKRQSFAKSVAGEPGATATLVRLTTTELVFIKFKDGTYSSNSVAIYANTQNIPNPVYSWSDGLNSVVKDSTTDITANTFLFNRPDTLGVYSISVAVVDKNIESLGVARDSISIAFIEEGSDAYTFLFKDPVAQLSANSLGVIEGGVTSVVNHIIGAQGIRLLVPETDIIYSIDSTENCIATLGIITGTWNQEFTISGAFFTDANITSAKVTIKCQVPNGLYYLMTTSYTKVRKGDQGDPGDPGDPGSSAIFVDLLSEADVVTTLADGTGYTLPSSNALRLYSGGNLVTTGVTYGGSTTKNGLTLTISNTPGSLGVITLSGANWTSNQQEFNVTATLNGVSYTAIYTVAKSRAGSDAVFVDLLSEAEVVNSAADGTGYTLPTGNSMRLFKGGTQITTGVSYSGGTTKNGLTLAIDGSTGAITLSGASWTTDKETFTLTATYPSIAGVAYTYSYKITKARQGTTGTPGANAVKSTSGYIYYSDAGNSAPQPSASSFNFSTGNFTGLTTKWSTTVNMTGNGSYWAARYVVTESAFGFDYGTPTFSTPFNHQNFNGLVTFTNLEDYPTKYQIGNVGTDFQGNLVPLTTIHGGNISTGTLTADRIKSGSVNTSVDNTQFAFGTGSVLAGISTVGYFKSQNSSILGLGVLSSGNIAFAASTTYNGSAGGFGNRNGPGIGIDDIQGANNKTMANFASPTMAAFIQKRSVGGVANIMQQDPNTQVFVKLAFNEAFDTALQASHYPTGYFTNLGTPNHAIYINGPVGPFTGSHEGLLDKSVATIPGDIMVDLNVVASKGVSDSITTVALSSKSNQAGPIGIYVGTSSQIPVPLMITVEEVTQGMDGDPSTTTVQKLNPVYESLVETHNYVIINSIGEGSINVCGEGGTIELGDLIVTSSVPGKGMRQSDDIVRSVTVAKARETVTFDSPTQVKQIACIYMCG